MLQNHFRFLFVFLKKIMNHLIVFLTVIFSFTYRLSECTKSLKINEKIIYWRELLGERFFKKISRLHEALHKCCGSELG